MTMAGVVAITWHPIMDVRLQTPSPKTMKRMIGGDRMKGKNVFEGVREAC